MFTTGTEAPNQCSMGFVPQRHGTKRYTFLCHGCFSDRLPTWSRWLERKLPCNTQNHVFFICFWKTWEFGVWKKMKNWKKNGIGRQGTLRWLDSKNISCIYNSRHLEVDKDSLPPLSAIRNCRCCQGTVLVRLAQPGIFPCNKKIGEFFRRPGCWAKWWGWYLSGEVRVRTRSEIT